MNRYNNIIKEPKKIIIKYNNYNQKRKMN